jgi:hypothetical protein
MTELDAALPPPDRPADASDPIPPQATETQPGPEPVAAEAIEPEPVAPEPVEPEPVEPEPLAPEKDVAPDAVEGPRTVGRYIADTLRAAGVRYAFTVPGESFLGLLEAFEGAGIRVIATRHEGAAAFMAEAHGQLTGRPAVALGTRARTSPSASIRPARTRHRCSSRSDRSTARGGDVRRSRRSTR